MPWTMEHGLFVYYTRIDRDAPPSRSGADRARQSGGARRARLRGRGSAGRGRQRQGFQGIHGSGACAARGG